MSVKKKFVRTVESFVCEKCGVEINGNGYTDHCPNCLYSKHVDMYPGDRSCDCRGLMKPIGIEVKNGRYKIHYKCEKCGYTHRVRSSKDDSFEKILELTGNI